MRIALLLGAFSVGARPLDMARIYTSPRGVTGTELAFARISEELSKLGHEVRTYLGDSQPRPEWESFDVVVSLNEPNLLIGLKRPRRVCYTFLNDWSFVQPGFDEWVDQYVGVCQQHAAYVQNGLHPGSIATPSRKWTWVPLGCDPHLYSDRRVPGRVIHTSCLTRGFHWLCQMWPDIKRAVPEAHLRVFYPWNYDGLEQYYEGTVDSRGPISPHVAEMGQRIRYIKKALPLLKPLGVEYVGAVSREQMIREYSEASVFAFPCDTVAFSEGFSVATLEAHAAGCVPIITDCDCLGSVYKDSGAWVMPLDRFPERVSRALQPFVDQLKDKRKAFAETHTWAQTAKKLEAVLS